MRSAFPATSTVEVSWGNTYQRDVDAYDGGPSVPQKFSWAQSSSLKQGIRGAKDVAKAAKLLRS